MSMGGRAEGLACTDLVARTPISVSGNSFLFFNHIQNLWLYNNAKWSLAEENVVYADKFNKIILWHSLKSIIKTLIL